MYVICAVHPLDNAKRKVDTQRTAHPCGAAAPRGRHQGREMYVYGVVWHAVATKWGGEGGEQPIYRQSALDLDRRWGTIGIVHREVRRGIRGCAMLMSYCEVLWWLGW